MRNLRRKVGASLGCLMVLAACSSPMKKEAGPLASGSWLITPGAAGPIRLGMTVGEAVSALGPSFRVDSPPDQPIIVINARHVVWDKAGEKVIEFLVDDFLHPNTPGNRITTIMATNNRIATAEGVMPGITIEAAAVVYGPATLRKSDEEGFGGEWVTFARAPAGLRFSVSGPHGGQAGLYEPSTFQSTNHVTGAMIHAIEIGRSFLN